MPRGEPVTLEWVATADEELCAGLHRVIHAVAERGGAVGWLQPPPRAETDAWLAGVLAAVDAGNARLLVARVQGRVEATGHWQREPGVVYAHSAVIRKVMAHPAARGRGLGRLVTAALVEDARTAGIETLTLGVRGNNFGAIELYEDLGFREWGRLPDVLEVGNERFDDVRMFLRLGRPPGVVLRGSGPGGPGSSPSRRRAG